MKLRNKKTGEIVEAHDIDIIDRYVYLKIFSAGDYDTKQYTSIAEFCEEWGDYEEPEDVWYIDWKGDVRVADVDNDWFGEKSIGNYFKTREEAEKAVEKLKAITRLQNKGFRFDGWDENHHNLGIIEFSFDKVENNVWDFKEDLDLLFGGAE